jgi:hypothetical protein
MLLLAAEAEEEEEEEEEAEAAEAEGGGGGGGGATFGMLYSRRTKKMSPLAVAPQHKSAHSSAQSENNTNNTTQHSTAQHSTAQHSTTPTQIHRFAGESIGCDPIACGTHFVADPKLAGAQRVMCEVLSAHLIDAPTILWVWCDAITNKARN